MPDAPPVTSARFPFREKSRSIDKGASDISLIPSELLDCGVRALLWEGAYALSSASAPLPRRLSLRPLGEQGVDVRRRHRGPRNVVNLVLAAVPGHVLVLRPDIGLRLVVALLGVEDRQVERALRLRMRVLQDRRHFPRLHCA